MMTYPETTLLSTDCKQCRSALPDLLLDPTAAAATAAARQHLAACSACAAELDALRSTFAALDDWTAPEPSPFFDTRLYARLREAQAAQPEGFFERVHSFLLFSTGRQLRPALAGALALVLTISGATFAGVHGSLGNQTTRASATVNDLKILDNNAQTLQQMDQLLDDGNDDNDPPST
jgi:hypothetical protein